MHKGQQAQEKYQDSSNTHRINRGKLIAKVTPDQPNTNRTDAERDDIAAPAKSAENQTQPEPNQRAGLWREET